MFVFTLIPAFQAEHTVGAVVQGVRRFFEHVIVIDDGSSDRTSVAAQDAGAELVRFERNRGKGAALRTGFARALERGAAAAITIDADGQHDPAEIPHLLAHWSKTQAGIVIGSRAGAYDGMTSLRRFGNRFSNRAVSYFAGAPIADAQSGLRLYDMRLVRQIPLRGTR
jgi:glycosyltransferase involved in cell wall biosynthesis